MNFKPSILRNLLVSFLGFGIAMGVVFPLYAQFFVEWLPGMKVWFNVGCLIAGIIIGVANYALVKLVLLRKLQQISIVANAISNNDISNHCTLESNDVIGDIIKSFNRMAENLRAMIINISAAAEKLDSSVHEMQRVTEDTQSIVERQQSQTGHVVAAMEEMTATVQEVAHYADDAANAARRADQEASDGHRVVDKTVSVIGTLAQAVEQGSIAIGKLQEDSDNIGTVLDVIKSVAEQTNLLALNAAIEAARAGEQGRGFAVVADEVRSLASRTQKSTQEIQQMIERLQAGTVDAVKEMDASRKHAQEGVQQASKAGLSLQAITETVSSINEMNLQIARAAGQQSTVVEEINHNVASINKAAESSVAGIHMTTSANSDLSQLASSLRDTIGHFKL